MPDLIECWGVTRRVERFEPDLTPREYGARRDEAPSNLDGIVVDASGEQCLVHHVRAFRW
jgi:hypothetical protein